MKRIGALEAGGTKMVCAIGDENGKIYDRFSIPTETPDVTIPAILRYFSDKNIESLGIACFGPVDLNTASATYGYITSTPKTAWKNFDIVGALQNGFGNLDGLHVPVGFDTDVNGSLLGEVTYGQAKGLTDAVYFTIGTGVGAGIMSGGKLVHGVRHPEAGHTLLQISPDDPMPEGVCPYHSGCLEGLASGPSIEKRWHKKAQYLTDRDEVWDLEAYYIAQGCLQMHLILSPQIIILGGGVMHVEKLFPMIRQQMKKLLNGYGLANPETENFDKLIVPASLNDDQGIMGAVKLGLDALQE